MRRRAQRSSRWDRPPATKDWRWVVLLIGRTMVITGLLLFGFVAYQLWGTGIEYARAQNQLNSEFDDLLAANGVDAATPQFTPGTGDESNSPRASEPPTVSAPSSTAAPTTTEAPPSSELPLIDGSAIFESGIVGQLWIPEIGIDGDMTIVEGVTAADLQDGPGRFPTSALPGELGNLALAGHRTTYGAPFGRLPDLEVGDEIAIVTVYGTYTYRVTGEQVVLPEESWVVETADETTSTLTLITCTPIRTSEKRHVVFAELVPELTTGPIGQYVDRGAFGVGLPELDGPATADPTTTSPPTTTATTAAATADDSTAPTTTAAPTTTSAPTTVATPSGPDAGDDGLSGALTSHWFDDPDAYPQIAGWAALTAAIAIAGYAIAKARRNTFVGVLVVFAPFLVALYFTYQNINRLLPAAL